MNGFLGNGDLNNEDNDNGNLTEDIKVSVKEPEEATDVGKSSFIDRNLRKIQNGLTKKRDEWPKYYNERTLWYDSNSSSFALRKQLSPEELYKPRVSIWLLHLLSLSSHKYPQFKGDLNLDGYTKDPKARRIIDFDKLEHPQRFT